MRGNRYGGRESAQWIETPDWQSHPVAPCVKFPVSGFKVMTMHRMHRGFIFVSRSFLRSRPRDYCRGGFWVYGRASKTEQHPPGYHWLHTSPSARHARLSCVILSARIAGVAETYCLRTRNPLHIANNSQRLVDNHHLYIFQHRIRNVHDSPVHPSTLRVFP